MNTNPHDWQKSISAIGHEMATALQPVAVKMGVAAEHLYGVLVRQSLVDGICDLSSALLAFGFMAYFGHRSRAWAAANEKSDGAAPALVLGWVSLGIGFVLLSMALSVDLPKIINPEYYAIKTLLDAVKGATGK